MKDNLSKILTPEKVKAYLGKLRLEQEEIHQKYKTTIYFIDETGLLRSPRDQFFGIGIIKCQKPHLLYLRMKTLRDQLKFYDEIKWSRIYHKNTNVMNKFIDLFLEAGEGMFSCMFFIKNELDLAKHFKGDLWRAYESFTIVELKQNLGKKEIAVILADDVSVPKNVRFEANVKRRINKQFNRLAIHTVCRLYSKGAELIQLTDLLLGAVAYQLKINNKLIPNPSKAKMKVLKHLKRKLKRNDLSKDHTRGKFKVWIFKPKKMGHEPFGLTPIDRNITYER